MTTIGQVTTRVERLEHAPGTFTQIESAAISSVELTVDSKGVVKPSVKVYHADPQEAATQALAVLRWVQAELAKDGPRGAP